MDYSSAQHTETPDAEQIRGEAPSFTDEVSRVIEVGRESAGLLAGLLDLARLELGLAVQSLPKLIFLSILFLPVLGLTWVSFSALVAWATYLVSANSLAGVSVFFVLQLALLLYFRLAIRRCSHYFSFPHTRSGINEVINGAKNEQTKRED